MSLRRALIIGIDEYPEHPLYGCVDDAEKLSQVLSRHYDGQLNFSCETLTSPPSVLTRPVIR